MTTKDEVRKEFISRAKQGYFDKFIEGRGEIDEEKAADWVVAKFDSLLAKKKEEIIKIKEAVAAAHGTNKYDSCYDDCLEVLDQ